MKHVDFQLERHTNTHTHTHTHTFIHVYQHVHAHTHMCVHVNKHTYAGFDSSPADNCAVFEVPAIIQVTSKVRVLKYFSRIFFQLPAIIQVGPDVGDKSYSVSVLR